LVQKAIEEEMGMGVIMHKSAKSSRQCVEEGNNIVTNSIVCTVRRKTANRAKDIIMLY